MVIRQRRSKRSVKRTISTVILSTALIAISYTGKAQAEQTNIAVSPVEDLMREHGVLSRILLIYEEIIKRIDGNKTIPLDALTESTQIIRNFIQSYHEKLEENYLFPRFRKANKLSGLVNTLLSQHESGRKIIDDILLEQNSADKKKLSASMSSFIRLYRPHKAREDTVLFPAFRIVVSPQEYEELGEEFEREEEKLFGEGGFERIVTKVEEIEKSLGIYELSQFTPAQYQNLPAREE